jgi:hypothetical protein
MNWTDGLVLGALCPVSRSTRFPTVVNVALCQATAEVMWFELTTAQSCRFETCKSAGTRGFTAVEFPATAATRGFGVTADALGSSPN